MRFQVQMIIKMLTLMLDEVVVTSCYCTHQCIAIYRVP